MSQRKQTYKQRLTAVRKLDRRGYVASYRDAAMQLVEDFPKRGTAWLELGMAMIDVAHYTESITALNKAIRFTNPKYRDYPFAYKGQAYRSQGKLGLAERWYRHALAVSPKNANWWAFLAAILARQGRLDEAKVAWRKQIGLKTGATDEGHYNLGLIYRAEGRYKVALRHVEKAIVLDPKYKKALKLRKDLIAAVEGKT